MSTASAAALSDKELDEIFGSDAADQDSGSVVSIRPTADKDGDSTSVGCPIEAWNDLNKIVYVDKDSEPVLSNGGQGTQAGWQSVIGIGV